MVAATRGRVLLVQHEPALLDSLARQLGDVGFDVMPVADGSKALKTLGTNSFDLVLSDIAMEDGLELLRRVREHGADIPVILVTDEAHRQSASLAKAGGAFDFLVKPIARDALERVVARATRPRHRRVGIRSRRGEELGLASVTATEAKNGFGRLLETALRRGAVAITKHAEPKAVLLSWDEFEELRAPRSPELATLAGEFDALLERMQSAEAGAAMQSAFGATPAELGEAAVAAARKRD